MEPVTLSGRFVTLVPLAATHLSGLQEAAADGELWKLFYTFVPAPQETELWLETALSQQHAGQSSVYVVLENFSGKVVGSTRYCNLDLTNRRLEIGHTWLAKRVQRSALNTECKWLLLGHAFGTLDCLAVEFRTDWLNHTSQRAIERLGAKQDGLLRSHRIMPNGRVRDTVVYSILAGEWPGVEENLRFRLERPC